MWRASKECLESNHTSPHGPVGSDVVEMSKASNKALNRKQAGQARVSRGIVNMAARCGGYAVRPMAWPMRLHWDRQRVEPQQRNAHPKGDQSGSMNPRDFSQGEKSMKNHCSAL